MNKIIARSADVKQFIGNEGEKGPVLTRGRWQ